MRILLFALAYWRDLDDAHRRDGRWDSYERWLDRVRQFFKPSRVFLASGTWSEPALNPLLDDGVPLVNAGAPFDAPYDWERRQYACCALSAAAFYALNKNDWDYLVCFDTDALVGAVDLPKLFEEFAGRAETILAPGWNGGIAGPFCAWKRRGVATLAHHRLYPNLCDPDEPRRLEIPELEWKRMYHDGRWWNPWPQFRALDNRAYGEDFIAQHWPFVVHVEDALAEQFEREVTPLAIPLP